MPQNSYLIYLKDLQKFLSSVPWMRRKVNLRLTKNIDSLFVKFLQSRVS